MKQYMINRGAKGYTHQNYEGDYDYIQPENLTEIVFSGSWYVDPKDGVLLLDANEPTIKYAREVTVKLTPWWKFWVKKETKTQTLYNVYGRTSLDYVSEIDIVEIENCQSAE